MEPALSLGSCLDPAKCRGYVLDPEKCSRLSLEQKRELVHQIARWSTNAAPEFLSSWTRAEILEIICAEMGKERKYSGLTKPQMIDHLLKPMTHDTLTGFKRQRQKEHLDQFDSDPGHVLLSNTGQDHIETRLCENVACQATLMLKDQFCKRCSCCICHNYDDNKDPSLWLTCWSNHHNQDDSCGMSCHLECALTHGKAGIMNTGCWRKQLLIAQSARRVDKLYHRLSLSHKILKGTERFTEQQKILDTAVTKTQKRSWTFTSSMLKFGARHCCNIRFEEASPGSVVVVLKYDKKKLEGSFGCRLWYRRSTEMYYLEKPAFLVLIPTDKYFFKVSMFNGSRELGVWEANYVTQTSSKSSILGQYEEQQKKLMNTLSFVRLEDINKNGDCHVLNNTKDSVPMVSSTSAPPTPYKSDGIHEPSGYGVKKHNSESDYEYCTRVIRWLEREGHMKKDLKATTQDIRVVTAYVDTLIDEPSSLADQIVDTFTDKICKEHRKPHP
ncbi:hypothetical protein MKW92_021525 [Papaver armeniacum]|nr:hypothetical protein MKW92_021525 [Papaver armeniacum]